MKIALIFLTIFALTSCGKPADLDAIENQFEKNASSYEMLTNMVKKDLIGERCFSVGTDNIGQYWEYSGKWSHSQDYQTKMNIDQVLDKVGIEPKKYSKYLELFSSTGSERITYCPPSDYYIMAHRSGLGISGCLLNIVKGLHPPAAYGKRNNGEDFMEIRLLTEGWWMEYECT
ncbi:hypothetical protein [uncultured Microbulbifer sp.]|uniref:hypothetical protein n=1 Tax=uncultured Microbulbifer sp. TaxID=348147 RepID=UPI002621C5A1|nr:hypothetical protein [uncultured Microbulbifer sp.]